MADTIRMMPSTNLRAAGINAATSERRTSWGFGAIGAYYALHRTSAKADPSKCAQTAFQEVRRTSVASLL